MLDIVCWLWGDLYTIDHVNRLYNMVERNYYLPFKFHCITDREQGEFNPNINLIPIWDEFTEWGFNYRRLKLLSKDRDIYKFLGFGRILQIDLDMVILKDFTHLLSYDRFKIWKCPSNRARGFMYNTSFMLFEVGSLCHIYETFKNDPESWIRIKTSLDWPGTDQAIISCFMHPAKTWDEEDGIYSFKRTLELQQDKAPDNVIIAGFYGRNYDPAKYTHLEWVKENWR